jgi:hypothetical protein
MRHTNHQRSIDRGRRAGLGTAELYRAMSAGRGHEADPSLGRADCNGFVSTRDRDGRTVFHPAGETTRS